MASYLFGHHLRLRRSPACPALYQDCSGVTCVERHALRKDLRNSHLVRHPLVVLGLHLAGAACGGRVATKTCEPPHLAPATPRFSVDRPLVESTGLPTWLVVAKSGKVLAINAPPSPTEASWIVPLSLTTQPTPNASTNATGLPHRIVPLFATYRPLSSPSLIPRACPVDRSAYP